MLLSWACAATPHSETEMGGREDLVGPSTEQSASWLSVVRPSLKGS
jgi:hypothetical protein